MPRHLRQKGWPVSYHIVARCNNEEFLFKGDSDFFLYLKCLEAAKKRHPFEVNNFTLMSNHVHLMITTRDGAEINKIFHQIHLSFSKTYNEIYRRSGHFWKDRYRSLVITDDSYGLACMRYINRNPLRAGMVKRPEEWRWSAYRFYAFGTPMKLITPFPSYLGLGNDPEQRMKIYRELVIAETEREQDEKCFFRSKLSPGSRRFYQKLNKIYSPLFRQMTTL